MEDIRCEEICSSLGEYVCFCTHLTLCFAHARLHYTQGHNLKAIKSKFSEPKHRWLGGHVKAVSCLAVNLSGSDVVTGSLDRTAKVWSVDTQANSSTLGLHVGSVGGVAFCGDGRVIAAIDSGKALVLWDNATSTAYKEISFAGAPITQLQPNFTGSMVAVVLSKNTAVAINITNYSQGQLRLQEVITKIAWHPNSNKLGLLTERSQMWVWDLSTNESSSVSIPGASTFTWTDDIIAVVLNNKSVVLVSPYTGELLQTLLQAKNKPVVARFDEATRRLVLATAEGQLYVEQNGVVSEHKLKLKKFAKVVAIEVRNSRVFYASQDSCFEMYDLETADTLELGSKAKQLHAATWCIEVRVLATVCERDSVDLWKVATGKQLRSFKPHSHGTSSLAWCSGPNLLATGGFDNVILLWKVLENECVGTLTQHTGAVMCLDFQPETSTLASGSRDQSIKVWDLETMSCLSTVAYTSEVEQLKFCSTELSACILRNTELKIVNALTGEALLSKPASGRLLKQMLAWCGHYSQLAYTDGNQVLLIEFPSLTETPLPNPNSLSPVSVSWGYKSFLLAVGYLQKNQVGIWDLKSLTCLQEIMSEVTGLTSLTWCYSSYLVTGGDVAGVWQVFGLWNRVKGFLYVHGRNRKINYQVIKELANFL